jgi:hypothetical protein
MLWRTRETPLALFIREEEFLNVQESERLTVSLLAAGRILRIYWPLVKCTEGFGIPRRFSGEGYPAPISVTRGPTDT